MLGDVPDPGALAQPSLEAADLAGAAGVLPDARQHLEQRLDEAGDRVGREVLEHAEVDDQLDRRLVVPVVRSAVDAGLDDLQLRAWHGAGRRAGGRPLDPQRRVATVRSLAGLPVHPAGALRPASRALRCRVIGSLGGDAPDQAPGLVRRRLEAGELAIGGADRAQRRHELALADVEPIAGRERVERDARRP